MKNWRFWSSSLAFVVFLAQTPSAEALLIPLRADWIANAGHHSTPAYVWQNDPEILKLYDVPSVTNLCVPAAIGTALINQFAYESPSSKNLKLVGYNAEAGKPASIDTAKLLADLAVRCKSDVREGTTIDDGVRCSAQFYQDSGYVNAKVKLIRVYPYSLAGAGAEHENRLANKADIEAALAQGYQVIASIAMVQWDEASKEWKKVGSHAVNVMGLTTDRETGVSKLFVTNPTRAYQVDGIHPIFDEATFGSATPEVAATLPAKYSPWLITGRLLTRPNSLTVLAGLLLLRTN